MKHNYCFQNKEIVLRPLEWSDIEPLRTLRNRSENRKWFFYDKEIDKDSQNKWFENYIKKPHDYMFAVCLLSNPNCILGSIALYDYDEKNKTIEVGRLLLDSKQMPRRHMSIDVIECVCNSAYQYLPELCDGGKIRAEVFEENLRSMNAFLSNGFSIVGKRLVNEKQVNILLKK